MTQQRNFDTAALNWDEVPRRAKLAGDIAAAILQSLPHSPDPFPFIPPQKS